MWNVEVRRERRLFPHFNSTFITPTEEEVLGRTLVQLLSMHAKLRVRCTAVSKECARGIGNVP